MDNQTVLVLSHVSSELKVLLALAYSILHEEIAQALQQNAGIIPFACCSYLLK